MNKTLALTRSVMLCSAAIAITSPGFAQTGTAQNSAEQADSSPSSRSRQSDFEVIVVTAQKKSERLTDVPMSIAAASGDELARQGVTDTTQLAKVVPGFGFQQGSYGTPVFSIRGIGYYDLSVLGGPTVAAYVDQVPLPLSSMTRGATLDLERVEVLKGPQGTLFGQNSTGGAINYIAAKPTDALEAGVDVGYGRFNEITAGGFVSGPLTDTLRARLSVRQERMDGWQKSMTRPGDTLGKKRFYNARLLLDWQPTETLSFALNVSGWQDRSDIPASQYIRYAPIVPVSPQTQYVEDALLAAPSMPTNPRDADWDAGFDFARNDKFYLLSLRTDLALSDTVNLTAITAYSHLETDRPLDNDGTAFSNFLYHAQEARARTFSQELRINGEAGPIAWMVGANYQDLNGRELQQPHIEGMLSGLNLPTGSFLFVETMNIQEQRPKTYSVFGKLDYELTSQLKLEGSVRYTKEDRKFGGCAADSLFPSDPGVDPARVVFSALSSLLSGSPTVIAPGGCFTMNDTTFKPEFVTDELKEDNISWRTTLSWQPDPDSLLYAYAARGYKSGGYSILPAVTASQFRPVTQESLLAFEAGFRTALLDRAIRLSAAAFYYDYRDKQLTATFDTIFFGAIPKLFNIPKSRVSGFEVEALIQPVQGLRFKGGVTYVNSKVQEDPTDPALDPFNRPNSFIGEAFPNTPKWQAIGDIDYNFPVSASANMFAGGTISYRGNSFAAFGEHPDFLMPAYTLIDLRAGIESADGTWRAQLWGRNVTNKLYTTNVLHLIDTVARSVGEPASYGISFSYRY